MRLDVVDRDARPGGVDLRLVRREVARAGAIFKFFAGETLRNTGELMPRSSLVLRPGVVDVTVLEPETGWTKRNLSKRVAALYAKFAETI